MARNGYNIRLEYVMENLGKKYSSKYYNDKQKEKYDKINILLPKGSKEDLKIIAKLLEYKGMNPLILCGLKMFLLDCYDGADDLFYSDEECSKELCKTKITKVINLLEKKEENYDK